MELNYSVATRKTVAQAIADLKVELSRVGFGVLWELSFRDKLAEKGLSFDEDFHVLEACNPHKAKEVLDTQIEIGFFLPCKLAVYTKEGQAYIGMPRPTLFMTMLDNAELMSAAREVEEALISAINAAR